MEFYLYKSIGSAFFMEKGRGMRRYFQSVSLVFPHQVLHRIWHSSRYLMQL